MVRRSKTTALSASSHSTITSTTGRRQAMTKNRAVSVPNCIPCADGGSSSSSGHSLVHNGVSTRTLLNLLPEDEEDLCLDDSISNSNIGNISNISNRHASNGVFIPQTRRNSTRHADLFLSSDLEDMNSIYLQLSQNNFFSEEEEEEEGFIIAFIKQFRTHHAVTRSITTSSSSNGNTPCMEDCSSRTATTTCMDDSSMRNNTNLTSFTPATRRASTGMVGTVHDTRRAVGSSATCSHSVTQFFKNRVDTFTRNVEVLTGRRPCRKPKFVSHLFGDHRHHHHNANKRALAHTV